MTERRSEATCERRLEVVDPLGREAGPDEGVVLGAQLISLLVVDRDPERADATEGVAGERLDRVDGALRPRHQLGGGGLADRLGGDVERGRHAAEGEASVAPACALGDPTTVVETHALARLRRAGAPPHNR